jgi:hypothetical protein
MRYKQNLKVENDKVYSYKTHVATINHENRTVEALGYWSQTTTKHINHVARECGYIVTTQA